MTQVDLPFKVGDCAEMKSFDEGYRGAWFRCKITRIFKKKKALFYQLKYLDYSEEGIDEIEVYKKPESGDENHLMVRPPFPRICHENEVLNTEGGSEEVLVVRDAWKVGDMVDWWYADCFWTGTVLEVIDDKSVKIELLPRPYGEGEIYDCLIKDLRPSLEWSLSEGWSVPSSEDGEKRSSARLITLSNEDQVNEAETSEEKREKPAQNLECDGGLMLNIMESESVEAAFMDLEESIVRLRWLQDMLAQDVSPSDTCSWKYEDYVPPSARI